MIPQVLAFTCRKVRLLALALVSVLLMVLLPLVYPAWGSREPPEKVPRTDLFQKAEQDSQRISQRMKAQETEESKKRQEEIIESENQNRERAIQKYRALSVKSRRR